MLSTAFPKTVRSFFGILYSAALVILSLIGSPEAGYTLNMPTVADDFVPAIRFAVCGDVHDRNDRLADMINTCYELYDNDSVYPGIDLFAVAGDMTRTGTEAQWLAYKKTLDDNIRGDTVALTVVGNHEVKNTESRELFTRLFGVSPEQHITVNGFHFITVSNWTERILPLSSPAWAAKELKAAEKESGLLPVFTFQHPHNKSTVYGSFLWSSSMLNSVWEGHSRVVNFSGHSHFPMNDPRSIWQGTYTALGTGSMSYFELEKDLVIGQNPEGYNSAAQFYIVEADLDGSVRISCYDLITRGFFGEEYYIDNVNEPSTFAYTYKNRSAYDDAPVFADNASAQVVKNGGGEYILSFDKASDKFIVHDYKITVKSQAGAVLYSKTHLSDYYLVNTGDRISFNLGKPLLKAGREYRLEITAVNAYYELSDTFKASFVA